jgi:predicted ATP-binding protein involved in virulence
VKVFIEKIFFKNRAPFDIIDIDLDGNEIAVLTAVNGRGKTTIISHIADAFHELAKRSFPISFEGKENKYYRVTSSLSNFDISQPSIFYLRLRMGETSIDYVDIVGNFSEAEYHEIPIENKIVYAEFSNSLAAQKSVKHWSNHDGTLSEQLFDSHLITYFPSYRYETPGYINKPYEVELDFKKTNAYRGVLANPLEVVTGLKTFANWLMDIVLDMQYSKTNVGNIKLTLDTLITLILKGKHNDKLYFGIGPRGYGETRIQIINEKLNSTVYPSIFKLSTGESAVLSMFGELIRQADVIDSEIPPGYMGGIVLIDEIDKHLHIKLQKEVLPTLLRLFPNVQFILSSHSPFLSMGLAEQAADRSKIIDLDNFGITKDPFTNDLYTEVYEMMLGDNERFRELYNDLKSISEKSSETIIVTEGKTDVQHLKTAARNLGFTHPISYFPVPNDWGDAKLDKLLEQLSKLKQQSTVIGIFDRDVPKVVLEIESNEQHFKCYGHNVYGFCLPTPAHRSDYKNISIEFFYTDSELKSQSDGKRLYFDNEIYYYQAAGVNRGKNVARKRDSIATEEGSESDKKIFDDDVSKLEGVHSKARFADLVENDVGFMKEFDFSSFKLIFDKIIEIENFDKSK